MAPSDPHSPVHAEYVPDIRELTLSQRCALLDGPSIRIFDDTVFAMELPRTLFLTASIQPRLIDGHGCVRLPPSTGLEPIMSVCCWLLTLCSSPLPLDIRPKKDMTAHLLIVRAGRLLETGKYVEHIHKHYWWKLYNKPFAAADVESNLKIAMGPEDCYLRLVSERLAAYRREGLAIDNERMEMWIQRNPMLKACINKADTKYSLNMQIKKEKVERAKRREAREACERKLAEDEIKAEEEAMHKMQPSMRGGRRSVGSRRRSD
ncbi:hypothetical protein K458DRAFT_471449 [Lentithecium fluviatile CBS 122367]|uniref:Uncharacterized protein n=1 Tax=Lentithecium fluviatile CBS 122367 TaxID=1168545 RepID=A0A6G1J761_9PLEO|nr:hypothetical protein K458DRAFT_471449 [Lentithecium fluviatile CBS 122367]